MLSSECVMLPYDAPCAAVQKDAIGWLHLFKEPRVSLHSPWLAVMVL